MASKRKLDFGPGGLDLTRIRGGDRNVMRVSLTVDGAPLPTVGAVVKAQARLTATDPLVGIEAEVTAEDESVGRYLLRWSGDDVDALLDGAESWSGVWDMEILFAGATEPETVLEGLFQAEPGVTV